MSEPLFLSLEQVAEIHRRSLLQHGGSDGVRDDSGLEAAVFQSQQLYFYTAADIHEIASAYGFHIAQAQAFIDGNKRAAIGAALTLLEVNGIETHTATAELHGAMIAIAERTLTRQGLAELLRRLFPAP